MEAYYTQKIAQIGEQIKIEQRRTAYYSWGRLVLFLASCSFVLLGCLSSMPLYIGILFFVCAAAMFIWLFVMINKDGKKQMRIRFLKQLESIYRNELTVEKENIFGNGKEYEDPLHLYTSDLDIFGEASLYQYINRTVTKEGRDLLADFLKRRADEKEIQERQEALVELSEKETFKEKFLSGLFLSKRYTLEEQSSKMLEFISHPVSFFTQKRFLRILSFVFPVLILSTLVVSIIHPPFYTLLITMILVSLFINTLYYNRINKTIQYIEGNQDVFFKYASLMQHIKNESFTHSRLTTVQHILFQKCNLDKEFLILSKLTERVEYRKNILVWFFINTFLFWDFHCVFSIEKWFLRNSGNIPEALKQIGYIDALLSLSMVRWNHRAWVFPTLSSSYFLLDACKVGHPLIPEERRVANDFYLEGKGKVDIITGSNMAGKSTFLRTLGVNMVLAFAGAPVCAESFTVSPVDILTYMRTRDSLNENTSSFYAELLRIKSIITEISTNRQGFLLLDELLKGTNSEDKHIGSVSIVKTLLKEETVALVSTHDLALTQIEKLYPEQVRNYHFDISVVGEDFYFSYTLQKGVCKNFNACLLMKKIGIELDDQPL